MSYESHIGKQIAFKGCIFTIKKMGMNTFQCARKCFDEDELERRYDCAFCRIPIIRGKLSAFELVLNVIATNKVEDGEWFVGDDYVELVDDQGFAHPGFVLCDRMPYIQRANSCDRITSRTQANTVYLFPNLNEKSVIQALILTTGGSNIRLELEKVSEGEDIFSEEAYEKLLGGPDKPGTPGTPPPKDEAGRIIEQIEAEEQAEIILAKAHTLQKLADQVMDTLACIGPRDVDSSIIDKYRVLNMDLRDRAMDFEDERDSRYEHAPAVVQDAFDEVQRVIDDFNKRESDHFQSRTKHKPAESLRHTPEEPDLDFEGICRKLLQTQGYSNIRKKDPATEGWITLFASRYGRESLIFGRSDVQAVEADDIRLLVEMMKQTHTTRGVFITTGHFTRAAEFKAMSESIDLIDGERIRSLGI